MDGHLQTNKHGGVGRQQQQWFGAIMGVMAMAPRYCIQGAVVMVLCYVRVWSVDYVGCRECKSVGAVKDVRVWGCNTLKCVMVQGVSRDVRGITYVHTA